MKKKIGIMAAITLALALSACGGKEESLTYTKNYEIDGAVLTDTITFKGKDDKLEQSHEVMEIDISSYSQTDQDYVAKTYQQMADSCGAIDGVESVMENTDGALLWTMDIDVTNSEAVKQMAELGIMQFNTGFREEGYISIKMSAETLENNGYTLME